MNIVSKINFNKNIMQNDRIYYVFSKLMNVYMFSEVIGNTEITNKAHETRKFNKHAGLFSDNLIFENFFSYLNNQNLSKFLKIFRIQICNLS